MRVAIYIDRGTTQLVLTPEGEWEQQVCAKMGANGEKAVGVVAAPSTPRRPCVALRRQLGLAEPAR